MTKQGPLTLEEMLQLWVSLTDAGYHQPLLEQPDSGLEIVTQWHEQLHVASEAVDVTTQAMFVREWSGQTNPAASGARKSTVTLDFQRTLLLERHVVVEAGTVVEHVQVDSGENGGVEVASGRRYVLLQEVVLKRGSMAVASVAAEAEQPGQNYDLPLPGTINRVPQPGSTFENSGASVQLTEPPRLVLVPQPDVLSPVHVGQYLLFTAGSNAGQFRRVTAYIPPTVGGADGGMVELDTEGVIHFDSIIGTFLKGEIIRQTAAGVLTASAVVLDITGAVFTIRRTFGTFIVTGFIQGVGSGASGTIGQVPIEPLVVAETGTAAWRVLDWVADMGLQVSNPSSPTGGAAPWLDEIGAERHVERSTGEGDDSYRRRVSSPTDVVSPNALRRATNRVLTPLGVEGCLREAGSEKLRGFFYDVEASSDLKRQFFYNMDEVLFPAIAGTTGVFFEGEPVRQVKADGSIAEGRAVLRYPIVSPPEPAATPVLDGVTEPKGTFAQFIQVVGLHSGARTTLITVQGGLLPQHAWSVLLSIAEFRAFFLMGVPRVGGSDPGFGWDLGGVPAWDSEPFVTAFDGFSLEAVAVYTAVYQALDRARAGGVGFDLYIEESGCV